MNKLEIVQKTLLALDSENVQSISDTVESQQISSIVDDVYRELLSQYDWPFLGTLTSLEVTDVPNQLHTPFNVYYIDWIKYNGKDIRYLDYHSFFDILQSNISRGGIDVDASGANIMEEPKYWTTVDDENILFDGLAGGLESNKSSMLALRIPSDMLEDTDVPAIPNKFHYVLLNGVISRTMYQLKGDDSLGDRYGREYKVGIIRMKKWASNFRRDPNTNAVDFGRKSWK